MAKSRNMKPLVREFNFAALGSKSASYRGTHLCSVSIGKRGAGSMGSRPLPALDVRKLVLLSGAQTCMLAIVPQLR